jgi:signal peptidase I
MDVNEKLKTFFKKFWYLLWKDDSWKGWLFSIVFLFIFIKFVFFPGLSFVTGTQLPLAIVESCSMYHSGGIWPFTDYNSWWDLHEKKYLEFNINKSQLIDFKFHNGFNKGDILFITGVNPKKLKIGDVIIFEAPTKNPVIHRIIKIENQENTDTLLFSTIGDNNNGQLSFENNIEEKQIIGKAQLKVVPYLGWAKLIFYEPFRQKNERGFCEEN